MAGANFTLHQGLGVNFAFSGCKVDKNGPNMFNGDPTEHLFVVDDFPQMYSDRMLDVLQVAANCYHSF